MTNDVRSAGARLRPAWVVLLALAALLWVMPAAARVIGVGEGVVPAGSGGGVQSLSVGRNYVCALRWDRSTQCWGENYNGQTSPPYQPFVAVRSGEGFSCGLDEAGNLTCWGVNYAGQVQPPLGPFTSFDLGRDRGCAIRTNGELACWGTDAYGNPVTSLPGTFKAVAVGEYRICGLHTDGQIECSDQSEQNPVPQGEFIAISAGAMQTCALRANGYAECWPGYSFPYGTIEPIADAFAEISVGEEYSCGLRTDGTVRCWGKQSNEVFPVPAGRFVAVVAGNRFACGVRPQGPVECWNDGGYTTLFPPMDLTAGTLPIRGDGVVPEANGRVRALVSGTEHSCALLGDGRVMCWGALSFNMPPLGQGFDALVSGSRHVCGLRRDNRQAECWGDVYMASPEQAFDALAAGDGFTCGLRGNGRVFCWGGPYGPGRDIDGVYVAVDAGGPFACGLRADGQSECWEPWNTPQRTQSQQLLQTVGTQMNQSCGLDITGRAHCWNGPGETAYEQWSPEPLVTLSVGEYNTCGLSAGGRLFCWGGSYYPAEPYQDSFTALSLGREHACGVSVDGTVRCWGNNYAGQATPPRELTIPYAIDAGDRHTCALQLTGELTCWGDNINGQVTVPNEPEAPAFVGVGSGDEFSCGLREDGRVQCWGLDANGQLQAPIDPFRQISIGRQHGCGIGWDGQVRCWGWNSNGQTDAPNDYYTRYRSVSAGFVHSCAVTEMGEGRCWGYSGEGQTWVPYLENGRRWISIQAGDQHSCGLRDDGMIQCWGSDRDGQIRDTPTGYFRALSAGAFHNCAIRTDGRLACWGGNWAGQSNAPEGTFVAVTAGSHHSCAISTEGVKQCWGDNTQLQAPPRAVVPPQIDGVPLNAPYQLRLWLIDANLDPSGYPSGGSGQLIEGASFRISDGVLPPGLSLSVDGTISGYASAIGTYPVTITAVDGSGFGASRHFDLVVDGTPPEVYPYVYGSYGTVNGWYTGTVNLGWSINDPESGEWVVSGCDWHSLSWDTSGVTFSCTAQSVGGTTTRSITLKRDTTAPETTLTATPAGNTSGSDKAFSFSGSDATSGVAGFECRLDGAAFTACTSPRSYTGLAAGSHRFEARAYDKAGHRDATPAVHSWIIDTTPPVVTPTVTGPKGANDWYIGRVQIDFALGEPDSPFTEMTGCGSYILDTDTPGASFTCTAGSAGGTTVKSVSLKNDVTRPDTTITAAPSEPSNPSQARFEFSGSDATSGVADLWCNLDDEGFRRCTSPYTVNVGAGTHTLQVMAQDAAGWEDLTPATHTWSVDGSSAVITREITGTRNDLYWYTTDVHATWTVSDPESPVTSSGCEPVDVTADTTGTDFTCSADSYGGHSSSTLRVQRDTVPPQTTLTATPPALSSSRSAQFTFIGGDATAGVRYYECSFDGAAFERCSSPYGVWAVPGAHTVQIRAVDNAYHADPSPAEYTWVVDDTPPTIQPVVSGAQGSNGWYVGDVQVRWDVSDAESPVSSNGCATVAITADTTGASFTCTASSTGGSTSRTVTVKRDATAPTIVARADTSSNAAGWYNHAVDVVFGCDDATSGVDACPGSQTLAAEGTNTANALGITDAAGNTATSNVVTVQIDRVAPTLTPSVTPGTLLLNAIAAARANGQDGRSGIASETCAPLATGSVGNKSVSCTVTDVAGNSATAPAAYRVMYGFNGFNSPVQNPSVLNVIKAGRSIPLRWRVVDAQGAPVTHLTSAAVSATAISCPSSTENRIYTYGGSNSQLQNLGNGYYQLDWPGAGSLRGYCRRLDLNLGDGQLRPAQFKFN